jgi:Ca2+-binding RTX toxin-like protein
MGIDSAISDVRRKRRRRYGLLYAGAFALLAFAIAVLSLAASAQVAPGQWQTLAPSSTNRQEISYVEADGKFYLAWGSTLHEAYDPQTNSWSTLAPLPTKLDHIQGVELGGKIYYIGGLSGWPGPSVNTVYIYDPKTDTYSEGTPMLSGRSRGAGGVAVHNGKIYYAGGLHNGVAVPWFDVYNPATNSWNRLPDMPRQKDHFQAVVVNGKFYAIGGRNTQINATIAANDAYNFATGSWQTGLAPLPTLRGGFAAAVLGEEILIIGGEGDGIAHNEVEAYNTVTDAWRTLAPMPTARHGIEAAVCNGGVYIAAGGTKQGGGAPTNVQEVFFLNGPTTCGSPQEPPPGGDCTITGTSANDTLTGTDDVADTICGGGGNDTIKGLGGNDTLKGEAGADKLSGGTGSDTLDGGLNNDTADFSGSLTAVTASLTSASATGEGSDTMTSVEWLTGSPKNDTLTGNGGNNTLNGGGGADTIDGLAGTDKLNGGAGLDMLHGGLGNDTVVGGGSADNLFGDEGGDSLNSQDGGSNDSLDGGIDTDTCVTDATETSIVNCEQ